jgi:hypothetical protein
MAASDVQIAQLRAMTAEPSAATYSDVALAAILEAYPLLDALGGKPFTWDYSTTPPTREDRDGWIPTYDLHAAAAQVWAEKATLLVSGFDFSADGATYSRSQAYEMAMKQSRHHAARRARAMVRVLMEPRLAPQAEMEE